MPKHPAKAYKLAEPLPNEQVLLQLLCTLPVTTSTAERTFSALRRMKTYLRTTMTEERLNGLALLHVHQDLSSALDAEEVLDVYARKHKRKLSLKIL
uniref:52 kDa repressor of the inhibitor of the protein kinase-like n=1 Tax=Diabrotica virgifera virgifera TaxID=50390 RepID=A0A6P7GT49_DIAVI